MGRLEFWLTRLWFALRDRLAPPQEVLCEVGIEEGWRVLDYGCGPGGYSIAVAELVGRAGRVYAADINTHALHHLQQVAVRKGLTNVVTIRTDCATGLDAGSVDLVLLCDTYHDLEEPDCVLAELHRVLTANGTLSFSDHHMGQSEILSGVASGGKFRLSGKGPKTYRFQKKERGPFG